MVHFYFFVQCSSGIEITRILFEHSWTCFGSSFPEPLLAWGDGGISVLLGWLMVWLVTAVMGVTWLHWELVSLHQIGVSTATAKYVFIYLYIYTVVIKYLEGM